MENLTEKRLHLLQEMGQIGVWEYYFQTKESWASAKVYELYCGSDFSDGFNPTLVSNYATEESKKKVEEAIHNLLEHGIPYDVKIEIHCPKTKEVRILRSNAKLIYDEEGNRDRVFGVVKDISGIMKQNEMLEIALSNFTIALNESPVPMVLHTEDGEVILINKKCLEISGYDIEEVNTIEKWASLVHKKRKKQVLKFIDNVFKNSIVSQSIEEEINTKSGEKRIWSFHVSKLDKLIDGRKAVISVAIDITEKNRIQEEEQKLIKKLNNTQVLLEASLESPKNWVIFSFDQEYKYLYFNERHKNIIKDIYNTEVKVGANVIDCISLKKDRNKTKMYYDKALKGESQSRTDIYGENNERYYESFYNPIYDENSEIIGASVFSSDITDRVHELQNIKDSEEKFRLIYSSMSQGLAVLEIVFDESNEPTNYRYVEINDSYEKLFNLKRENVIGRLVTEVAPSLEKYWLDVFGQVAITGVSQYYENYFAATDRHYSTYTYSPKVNQFAVLISDITDRIRKDEEIVFLSNNDQLTGVYNRRFYEEQFIKLDKPENFPLSLIMGDVNGLKLVNDSFGHLVGDELLRKVATILTKSCRGADVITRIGGDEFVVILPNTTRDEAELVINRINSLASQEKVKSIDISISFGFGTKVSEKQQLIDIFREIEDDMYRKKLNEGASMRSNTIDLIIATLYEKNEREMNHSKRVSSLSERLGIELGFDKDMVNQIKIAGLMHDIGKIGIDESILNKSTGLNRDEWKEVKKHSEIGYRILSSLNEFSEIADHILAHHEKWNGTGYPKGLKGEQISIQARVINIADAFDAMTGKRTYKNPSSKTEAIDELRKFSGIQFDPNIVEVFINKVLNKEN